MKYEISKIRAENRNYHKKEKNKVSKGYQALISSSFYQTIPSSSFAFPQSVRVVVADTLLVHHTFDWKHHQLAVAYRSHRKSQQHQTQGNQVLRGTRKLESPTVGPRPGLRRQHTRNFL
ncbi:hypothetical protein R103_M30016 [Saccharomyces cerevisiae R103]|uniref:EC1118_1M3_5083p n=1 Tax=Saccharomyces cerevisiae (strain Lalvin EC1118 / Prise de mousse) TaxID=643680 RepID=C8ZFG3_YEAS8|nr:hypothetical protein R008_M13246 [Saccharomyces cerevisiae R008]EWG93933.1 hypothetical protein R103_M30016 [Saccharomyces cerevisiae R103]CAY82129.1 EC1118_1M3_5083p [Saccharomyces cerevisiae EC1118]